MSESPLPTGRELEILKVLWDEGEATVRAVYERLSRELPIVQNTVQAFLRTMEEKGLVKHRVEGRSFIYSAVLRREQTNRNLVSSLLNRAFDGAMDQLVQSALDLRNLTPSELERLEELIRQAKKKS